VTPIQTLGPRSQAITNCPSVKVGWKEDKALKCRVFTVLLEAGQCSGVMTRLRAGRFGFRLPVRVRMSFPLLLIFQTNTGAHPPYYSMRTGDKEVGA